MKEEDLDSAEAEQLELFKECLSGRANKLTDEQLQKTRRALERTISEIGDIEKIRKEEKKAEADRLAKEKQRAEKAAREERERRRIAEEQAKIENARKRIEESKLFDNPQSPAFSTSQEHSEIISNHESTINEEHEVLLPTTNMPTVDFLSFIESDGAFLMLKKDSEADNVVNILNQDGLAYPLGVAYDEKLKLWLICDRNLNKILILDIEKHDFKICDGDGGIRSPTAVIVYTEGHNAAVLCADEDNPRRHNIYIYHYNTDEPFLQVFANHSDEKFDMTYPLRGLAKSLSGNLLSLENGRGPKRLRVFKRDTGGKGFEIRGGQSPSFIATYRSTVAISDLIVNKVFIINLDDTNWRNISFQMIRIIDSDPKIPTDDLANQNGFKFVSGMQFDVNGHLLIGDAKGHSIKLYDSTEYNFLHRISSDFVLPYVSSFHVNKDGECVLLDVQGVRKFHWVKMTSISQILPWMAPNSQGSMRGGPQRRRGGFQSYR